MDLYNPFQDYKPRIKLQKINALSAFITYPDYNQIDNIYSTLKWLFADINFQQ